MNSKTTLPLLDAAAHDEVVDVLRRLTVAYPDNTPNDVALRGREGRSYR
jgi:hypothetical protein